MTDEEFYSLRICPNCKHNNKRQLDLYRLFGRGKCWTCNCENGNFKLSAKAKRKLKELGIELEKNDRTL